jgi:preprotein translocase subunit SecE
MRGDKMAAFIANVGRGIRKGVTGTTGFFRSSIQELKKVRWPTRKELITYTLIVVSMVIAVTLFFFVIDYGIASLVKLITK